MIALINFILLVAFAWYQVKKDTRNKAQFEAMLDTVRENNAQDLLAVKKQASVFKEEILNGLQLINASLTKEESARNQFRQQVDAKIFNAEKVLANRVSLCNQAIEKADTKLNDLTTQLNQIANKPIVDTATEVKGELDHFRKHLDEIKLHVNQVVSDQQAQSRENRLQKLAKEKRGSMASRNKINLMSNQQKL